MEAAITTCKNCGHPFTGKYCNACGEKVYTDHDRTMAHIFEEGFHFFTHFEGTFFTTLKYIFTRPGKLSQDYCFGKRKSLFKPMSLFFLLVLIYLLFPVFEGLNMRLLYHLDSNFYGEYATRKAGIIAQSHNWPEAQLAEAFQKKSEKVSKFLLIILLPLTAFYFWAFTFRKRPYFFDQMVFATEINSVYLIWGFIILPLLLTLYVKASKAVFQSGPAWVTDENIAYLLYSVLLFYIVIAVRRFYKVKWVKAILISLLFYVAHWIIVQLIYKFLLFELSMRLLH
jgi:hypothetical protein